MAMTVSPTLEWPPGKLRLPPDNSLVFPSDADDVGGDAGNDNVDLVDAEPDRLADESDTVVPRGPLRESAA